MANNRYRSYLKSSEWAKIKIYLFESRGKKCERCGSKKRIQVHHKTYERIFNEDPSDLELLCELCHEKEHGITRKNGRKKKVKKQLTLAKKVLRKKRLKKNRAKKKLIKKY